MSEVREQIAILCGKGMKDCDYDCVNCEGLSRLLSHIEKDLLNMTVISDEEIGNAVLAVAVKDEWCFRGDTLMDNLPSYRAIAQAQVNADKDYMKKRLR